MATPVLSTVSWNRTVIGTSLAIAALVIYLLGSNYLAQVDLQTAALTQFRLDTEQRAEEIRFLFAERLEDLRTVAAAKELPTFFTNKALGMSMEYGLRASLLNIHTLFEETLHNKSTNGKPTYEWIAFIEPSGEILAISPQNAGVAHGFKPFKAGFSPHVPHSSAFLIQQQDPVALYVHLAYRFKGVSAGYLIASLNLASLQEKLSKVNTENRYACLALDSDCLRFDDTVNLPFSYEQPYALVAGESNTPIHMTVHWKNGSPGEMLAISQAIPGTPLHLITFTPTSQLFGYADPQHLLLATGLVALIILSGTALLWRGHIQNIILRTRVDEARNRQALLEQKNQQLQIEIDKRQQSEEQLHHLAHHDSLTHLPNRILFNDRLLQAITRAHRQGYNLAVIFFDLDRFKNINDVFGHPVGDLVIQTAAQYIRQNLRQEDTVARLGGDEFIAILEGIHRPEDAALVAQKVLNALTQPFKVQDHELFLSASAGISLYPRDGQDATDLIRTADIALYRAKEQGRNTFQFYETHLTTMASERFALEKRLRGAVERGELSLYYQPQVSLVTGQIVGAEALLRWYHPEVGTVSPAIFIPLAEESGLIREIGEWVVYRACEQLQSWQLAGLDLPRLAINISSRQVIGSDLYQTITNALTRFALKPEHLEIEITETCIMQKPELAVITLRALKQELGVSIAIDDFGTGYSSMAYLKRFKVDTLKIDKSFICEISSSENDQSIIKAIIALCRSLQLKVVAEGVETPQQQSFLRKVGCDVMQGYLVAEPLPAEAFAQLLERSAEGQPHLKRVSWSGSRV